MNRAYKRSLFLQSNKIGGKKTQFHLTAHMAKDIIKQKLEPKKK